MEITDRLYGQLGGDGIKAVVTGSKIKLKTNKEELFSDFLGWQKQK